MVFSNLPKKHTIFLRISTLTSKKREIKKLRALYTTNWMILFWLSYSTILILLVFQNFQPGEPRIWHVKIYTYYRTSAAIWEMSNSRLAKLLNQNLRTWKQGCKQGCMRNCRGRKKIFTHVLYWRGRLEHNDKKH